MPENNVVVSGGKPSVLDIQARHLVGWAETIESRTLFPELIKRLITETNDSLLGCDLPSLDRGQKHGFDGQLTAVSKSLNVPEGKSIWELGVGKDPKSKANGDFDKRSKEFSDEEQREVTFIFSTLQSWEKAETWVAEKKVNSQWKDIQVVDADQMSHWLSVAPITALWLKEKLEMATSGFMTADAYWNYWAGQCTPQLSLKLFQSQITKHNPDVKNWLTGNQISLSISSHSRAESLAFITALALTANQELLQRLVIVNSSKDIAALCQHPHVIPVTFNPIITQEIFQLPIKPRKLIEILEPQFIGTHCDIKLMTPDGEDFRLACDEMNINDGKRRCLENETQKSPTLIRRKYVGAKHEQIPAWSQNKQHTNVIVACMFAGNYTLDNTHDLDVLKLLADEEDIENILNELTQCDDAPLWAAAGFGGIVGKLETLYQLKNYITREQLENFFVVAEMILGETDPALTLDRSERWMAAVHGLSREYSNAVRQSIRDTLVMLSVHGSEALTSSQSSYTKFEIDALIRRLLPLDTESWQLQKDNLSNLAEAAPEVFLELVEQDLTSEHPSITVLFDNYGAPITGTSSDRPSVIWALELLAWSPAYLMRVIRILATLDGYTPDDNLCNSPMNTMTAIFFPKWPQTSASKDERIRCFNRLHSLYPELTWELAKGYLANDIRSMRSSSHPTWRSWASNCPVIYNIDVWDFTDVLVSLIITRKKFNVASVEESLLTLSKLSDDQQAQLIANIACWINLLDSAEKRIEVGLMLSRRFLKSYTDHRGDWNTINYRLIKPLYDLCYPAELRYQCLWWFTDHHTPYVVDTIDTPEISYSEVWPLTETRRVQLLTKYYKAEGGNGIEWLLDNSKQPFMVGSLLSRFVFSHRERLKFFHDLAKTVDNDSNLQGLRGGLASCPIDEFNALLNGLLANNNQENETYIHNILSCLPFQETTWGVLDILSQEQQQEYWRTTKTQSLFSEASSDNINLVTRKLLDAQRPIAALDAISFHLEKLESYVLIEILEHIILSPENNAANKLDVYDVRKALEVLAKREVEDLWPLALVEVRMGSFLDKSQGDFIFCNRLFANDPAAFFYFCAIYSLNDAQVQHYNQCAPKGSELPSKEVRESIAMTILFDVLGAFRETPRDLSNWVDTTREQGNKYGNLDFIDSQIAALFARTNQNDALWPPQAVADEMEKINNSVLRRDFSIEVQNLRGVCIRPNHGDPERELSSHFERHAKNYGITHPFVASVIRDISSQYEREARRFDELGKVDRRLIY